MSDVDELLERGCAPRQPRVTAHGFTLLELMIVVVLLVLMSGLGIAAARRSLSQAAMQRAVSAIVAGDEAERMAARNSPDRGRLVLASEDELRFASSRRIVGMPADVTIDRLWVVDARQRVQESSDVHFAASGQTPTYGVELSDADGHRSHVLFLGISGQVIHEDGDLDATLGELGIATP